MRKRERERARERKERENGGKKKEQRERERKTFRLIISSLLHNDNLPIINTWNKNEKTTRYIGKTIPSEKAV